MNRQVSTLTLVNGGAVPLAEVPVLDFGAFAGELVEEVASKKIGVKSLLLNFGAKVKT